MAWLQPRGMAGGSRGGGAGRGARRLLCDRRKAGQPPTERCANEHRSAHAGRRAHRVGRMSRALLALLWVLSARLLAQLAALPARAGLPPLPPIVEKVTPALVNIALLQKSPEQDNQLMRDPF